MASRLKLQQELRELLKSNNVYFQPPESFRMKYPCLRYSLNRIDTKKANNKNYMKSKCYQLIYITEDADDPLVDTLLDHFESISFDRQWVSDNLYHTSFILYY